MKRWFSPKILVLVLALGSFVLGGKRAYKGPCAGCVTWECILCVGKCIFTLFQDCKMGGGVP